MDSLGSPLGIILIIGSVLVSITLHEAMHAYAAHWLGDDTARMQGRLTLNPLKHIDPFLTVGMPVMLALLGAPPLGAAKPVPFNPLQVKYEEFGAAIVGAAGPLTNFVLAAVSAVILRASFGVSSEFVLQALATFTIVNLSFFVFNMIPFPPLDGSRVLYAFAPDALRRVMAQIESFGLMGFLIFFLLLFPMISPIIGEIINNLYLFLVGF